LRRGISRPYPYGPDLARKADLQVHPLIHEQPAWQLTLPFDAHPLFHGPGLAQRFGRLEKEINAALPDAICRRIMQML